MKYLIFLLLIVSCTTQPLEHEENEKLELVYQQELGIPEPSGLTYDSITKTLWCVSDANGKVYQLDTLGTVIKSIQTNATDLEGIAFDSHNSSLWLIDEAGSKLINITQNGEILKNLTLDFVEAGNSGLEGICINDSLLCVLKEKNPGYFYSLSSSLALQDKIPLDFASDYSGIFSYDADNYWILSDQSQKIFLWNSITNKVEKEFNLQITKLEGIVFLSDKNIFYIVSDNERKLYKYKILELF